ncbi:hypothetical protein BGX38DRAFT_1139010 [Terfezia claveryi]|nr:hypothetical protein BGX38DRAFT_1139010 [Terfezia claveryi]
MPNVVVPASGWSLGTAAESITNGKGPGGTPNLAPGAKQLMRIQFAGGTLLEDLIKAGEFKVSFGKTITFLYGNQAQEVLSKSEQTRQEIYETTDDSLNFMGLITHQLEARKLEKDEDNIAEVLALKQQMSALKDQKESKSTMLVEQRGAKGLPSRRPAPIGVRRRPGTGPEAIAKTPAQTSAETEAKMNALRAPIIHLLALGSDSERNIAMKTHAPVDLCLRILQRIGNRTRAGNHWQLVDDIYRNLDLWKFPYGNQKDRDVAIENAKAAFVRLRLPAGASEWDLLVKPEDRGKVKVGPPPPTLPKPKPLPNLNISKVEEGRIIPPEASPTASENSVGAEQLARSTSSQPPNKTRRVGEKDRMDKIIANGVKPLKAKKEAAQKEKKEKAIPGTSAPKKLVRPLKPKSEAAPKPIKRQTKWKHPEGGIAAIAAAREAHFKSEKFVQSDSDAEGSTKASVKSPLAAGTQLGQKVAGKSPLPTTGHGSARVDLKTASPAKKRVTEAAKATKRTAFLEAKKTVAVKVLPAKAAALAPERTRPIVKATGTIGGKRPLAARGKAGEKEPLVRTASAVKRSPTGSSPTVTSQEAGSVTSTPKTLTSIGTVSTPTRSPSHTITVAMQPSAKKQPRFVQETTAVSAKRKAERAEEDAPPKAIKRQKLPDANTLNLARRFKEEYAKYAKLYKEAQNEGPQQNEKLRRVLKMHGDLAAMKLKLSNFAAA